MPKWYPFLLSKRGDNGLLSHVSERDGVFVQKDSSVGASRQFAKFKDHKELYDYIIHQPQKKRCFYETIMGERPHKMYFDIDGGSASPSEIAKIIDEILISVKKLFLSFSLHFDFSENVLLFSSSDSTKQSYHIVLDGYYVNNYKCAQMLYDKLKIRENPYVDRSMYSSKQQFRLLGCQKLGSSRIKRYLKNFNNYSFRDLQGYDLFRHSCVCNVQDCRVLPIQEKIKKMKEISDIDIGNIPEGVLDPLFEAYELEDVTGGLVKLTRKCPAYCNICERVHDNENAFLIVTEEESTIQHIDFVCFRDETKRKRIYTLQVEKPLPPTEVKKNRFQTIAYLERDLMG